MNKKRNGKFKHIGPPGINFIVNTESQMLKNENEDVKNENELDERNKRE